MAKIQTEALTLLLIDAGIMLGNLAMREIDSQLQQNERGIRLLTHAPLVTYRYYDGLPVTDAPGRPTPAYKRVTP